MLDLPHSREYSPRSSMQWATVRCRPFARRSRRSCAAWWANGLGYSILNFPLKSNRTVDGEDFVIKRFKDNVNATTLGIAQSRTMKPRQVVQRFASFCETYIQRLHVDA